MSDPYLNYWMETVQNSLTESGIYATREQIEQIASDVQCSHENYGLAFHSPSSNDRYEDIQREYEKKIADLKNENNKLQVAAKTAVSRILNHKYDPSKIIIDERGDVFIVNGRTSQIT
jgi:hypothetical protein